MVYDNDDVEFSPIGVVKHIVMLMIGIILVTVLIGVSLNSVYDVDVEKNNGPGLGLPMSSANGETEATLTFVQNGDKVIISGDYESTVSAQNIVLVLSDNQSVYVRNGGLHYYDGTTDTAVTEVTVTITNGTVNTYAFQWLYYPAVGGVYRTYDGSVAYDVDQQVAGMGAYDGNVIISMNDTVSSDNTGNQITVYIERNENDGISGIKYRWDD